MRGKQTTDLGRSTGEALGRWIDNAYQYPAERFHHVSEPLPSRGVTTVIDLMKLAVRFVLDWRGCNEPWERNLTYLLELADGTLRIGVFTVGATILSDGQERMSNVLARVMHEHRVLR